jgi:hypothetical protein
MFELTDSRFFLFGMGSKRRKLLYRGGRLTDLLSGELLASWDVDRETLSAADTTVFVETREGKSLAIIEDEEGIWIAEGGDRRGVSESPVRLPEFEHHPFGAFLRVCHHEILLNVMQAGPVPNFLAYSRPWYRDAAMMCMVLEITGNLPLVEDWIAGLREPYDRNNAGQCEPDNLGQLLYMISLTSNASHPLVGEILRQAELVRKDRHIAGMSDFQPHPVYQTKWLKYGLRALKLDDSWEIPTEYDSYSSLFWMDYKDAHVPGKTFSERDAGYYPYLAWAQANFLDAPPPMHLLGERFPLTWEAQASQANYSAMAAISEEYVDWKLCAPHAWHAAEVFLYLHRLGDRSMCRAK